MKSYEEVDQERNIDIKKLFFRALNYWYLWPIFLGVALIIAYISWETTPPMHRVSARIMISDAQEGSAPRVGMGQNMLPGISLGNQSHIENQAIILRSRRQIERALRQLDFGISYYEVGRFRKQEIYRSSPFRVLIDSSEVSPPNATFNIEFKSLDRFVLTMENDKSFSKEAGFYERITHPRFSFSVLPIEENMPGSNYENKTYSFTINNINQLIGHYQANTRLEPVHYGSTIVDLSILENNPQKGVDFLNALSSIAVNYTLERKNQVALNTIQFIESQLEGVADSLSAAENVLENFRSRHEIMDVSHQGQMIITRSRELEDQRSAIMAKLDYYSYLVDYIDSNRDVNEIIAPSSAGIDDPMLSQLIRQLSDMSAERSAMMFNATSENPNITRINASIENLKSNIQETIKSVVATTNLTLEDINRRLYNLSTQIRMLPRTEQRLLNIERSRQMNNETYTFLLNRLTEAQLAKASNQADNEIIEEAMIRGMVQPNSKQYMIMILLGGLLLPTVVVFLLVFTNDKVLEAEDIKDISPLPIIGEIPFNKPQKKKNMVTEKPDNTLLSESFRSIRTSLGYYKHKNFGKTILITSILPGEGKSFCAINLARSFAMLDKKTLLIEFDMRRPSLTKHSGISVNGNGLSKFYTGDATTEEIIHTDTNTPNLHIIFSGQIPPNPSELIASDSTKGLLEKYQEQYDVVILDTPPLGLVADAHLLTEYADANILVVRHNSTPKPVLKINLRDEKVKNIPHLSVLMNGIPFQKKEYSYKYGYNVTNNKYFAN
ncbi:GumC family protein [Alkalitalea saponilacus]|uniref:non-specific protein-tyrosine kinase n=1 Tax=Alkalitalea saponilacus TaxID=889453 RepID=A0A1T5GLP2_9BACT|nr:polysaccharide biosynthesis tyrosine autokinase [Alkalitalea saponilacus]ASB48284.1 hypothetical protein CDL62_03570 [Alkalitalea saponilacus]SKC09329.1 capsular exopolysaccharide family [Alkalitalea saponilacus]